jgi:hypothetical protein
MLIYDMLSEVFRMKSIALFIRSIIDASAGLSPEHRGHIAVPGKSLSVNLTTPVVFLTRNA